MKLHANRWDFLATALYASAALLMHHYGVPVLAGFAAIVLTALAVNASQEGNRP